jgi:hypothetical protein
MDNLATVGAPSEAKKNWISRLAFVVRNVLYPIGGAIVLYYVVRGLLQDFTRFTIWYLS